MHPPPPLRCPPLAGMASGWPASRLCPSSPCHLAASSHQHSQSSAHPSASLTCGLSECPSYLLWRLYCCGCIHEGGNVPGRCCRCPQLSPWCRGQWFPPCTCPLPARCCAAAPLSAHPPAAPAPGTTHWVAEFLRELSPLEGESGAPSSWVCSQSDMLTLTRETLSSKGAEAASWRLGLHPTWSFSVCKSENLLL